jgi:NhaP-type Na+/H+ or K+/H+ antiporter
VLICIYYFTFVVLNNFVCFIICLLQWISWRLKIPAIIFLLIAGIILGPVLSIINTDKILGNFLSPFISLSVAVILFEGSLTLKFSEIKGLKKIIRNMVTFGMLITFIITAIFTKFIINISWELSFLFGAITVVTGPTVIVPLLRAVRPKPIISKILKWEGILIDPIGAVLSILVYEFIINKNISHSGFIFLIMILISTFLGIGIGYLYGIALKKHWIPEFLQNVATLSLVIGLFTLSNLLQEESGLLTVTILGITLANVKDVNMEDILNFKESLSILLTSLLFIFLAAKFDINTIKYLGWKALMIFLIIQFLSRPVNVLFSTINSGLSFGEKAIISWIAPRGIVAAAISSFFAIHLKDIGFENSNILVSLTFIVIIGTIVLQSFTGKPLAKLLNVAEDEVKGIFIVGANIVARKIAEALKNNNYNVILADTSWEYISAARLEGLDTYLGNPISEHASRHLDLIEYGKMFGLTPFEHVNLSNIMHFCKEFGTNNVYMIKSKATDEIPERALLEYKHYGKLLFGKNITYNYLKSLIEDGAKIHTTKLTEEFTYEKFLEMHNDINDMVLLFAIDNKENIHIYTEDEKINPLSGWRIIYLKIDEEEN